MKTTSFILTLVGAASALVARAPLNVDTGNTLIQYQPWCPVCDTVAINNACLEQHASCQGSVFNTNGVSECETSCNSQCQRITYVANSDYGYSCNVTRSATNSNSNNSTTPN